METVYFFSDESGLHTGGRYFLVAGAVFGTHRTWMKQQLEHAERVSCKGKQDWKGTKLLSQRVRYISEVLKIKNIQGTIYYAAYRNNNRDYWRCTTDALVRAIGRYAAGRHCIVRHQGFNAKTRMKLHEALRCAGVDYEIQSGSEKRAEIRLADALCGYISLMQINESKTVSVFPEIPGWFVDLKNEAPPWGFP